MEPTVGRIVHYRPLETEQTENNLGDIAPALITRVEANGVVNLKVFFDGGTIRSKTSVANGRDLGQWSWPQIPPPQPPPGSDDDPPRS